jgi:hypothetical protein
MKKISVILAIVLLQAYCSYAQVNLSPEEIAIKQTALDYAEGWYSGDPGRMERAIHFDLNKAFPRYIQKTGRTALNYSTYSQLIEYTRAKLGELGDTARHLKVEVMDFADDIANVKVGLFQIQ